jgi:hypothetical protein
MARKTKAPNTARMYLYVGILCLISLLVVALFDFWFMGFFTEDQQISTTHFQLDTSQQANSDLSSSDFSLPSDTSIDDQDLTLSSDFNFAAEVSFTAEMTNHVTKKTEGTCSTYSFDFTSVVLQTGSCIESDSMKQIESYSVVSANGDLNFEGGVVHTNSDHYFLFLIYNLNGSPAAEVRANDFNPANSAQVKQDAEKIIKAITSVN